MPTVVIEESVLAETTSRHDDGKPVGERHHAASLHGSKEFVCGWGAALVNISLTFPINKAMFRQQLHGVGLPQALRQLHREGLRNLYRGLLPPLLQKTTGLALMFGMYDQFFRALNAHNDLPYVVNQVFAGNLSGCAEAVLTPFERVQTLMQDRKHQGRFRNTFHAFSALRVYGLREYYRGTGVIIARNGMSNAMFFTLREPIRECLPRVSSPAASLGLDFVSGAMLGAGLSILFFPLNVVKTRMQCTVGERRQTAWQAFQTIFRERGRSWRKLFLGVHVNYTRSLLSWGIINASYEVFKKLLSVES